MEDVASNSCSISEDEVMSLWPSIVDGLTWSEGSEIAIAAREHVLLLVSLLASTVGFKLNFADTETQSWARPTRSDMG